MIEAVQRMNAILADPELRRVLGSDEKHLRTLLAERERYKAALQDIRNKVHAHNRGGELYSGLRNVVRDICDLALAKEPK